MEFLITILKALAFLLGCALIFCFTSVQPTFAQSATEEPSLITRLLAAKTVAGAWQLNSAESDDVVSKIQEKISDLTNTSLPMEKGDTQQAEIPSLSISLFPPETLTLIGAGSERAITINEGFKNIVMTRTYPTDGRPQLYQLRANINFAVRAFQQDKKLVVETVSPRGNKLTETYALAKDGNKLNVTIYVETPGSQELLALRRVYDRAAVELVLPPDDGGDSQ